MVSVYQLDRFRTHVQARREKLSQPCTRNNETIAVTVEHKALCSLSFVG
jgi:hypothetical protein